MRDDIRLSLDDDLRARLAAIRATNSIGVGSCDIVGIFDSMLAEEHELHASDCITSTDDYNISTGQGQTFDLSQTVQGPERSITSTVAPDDSQYNVPQPPALSLQEQLHTPMPHPVPTPYDPNMLETFTFQSNSIFPTPWTHSSRLSVLPGGTPPGVMDRGALPSESTSSLDAAEAPIERSADNFSLQDQDFLFAHLSHDIDYNAFTSEPNPLAQQLGEPYGHSEFTEQEFLRQLEMFSSAPGSRLSDVQHGSTSNPSNGAFHLQPGDSEHLSVTSPFTTTLPHGPSSSLLCDVVSSAPLFGSSSLPQPDIVPDMDYTTCLTNPSYLSASDTSQMLLGRGGTLGVFTGLQATTNMFPRGMVGQGSTDGLPPLSTGNPPWPTEGWGPQVEPYLPGPAGCDVPVQGDGETAAQQGDDDVEASHNGSENTHSRRRHRRNQGGASKEDASSAAAAAKSGRQAMRPKPAKDKATIDPEPAIEQASGDPVPSLVGQLFPTRNPPPSGWTNCREV